MASFKSIMMKDSIFFHTNDDHVDGLNAAKNEIVHGMHPILAMAQAFARPVEEAEMGFEPKHFRSVKARANASPNEQFIFPEPSALMGLCLYLGIHPADLVPKEMNNQPAPRAIVYLCRVMASDTRLPAKDRERADDFLDNEMATDMSISDKDMDLWNLMCRLDIEAETESRTGASMEWDEKIFIPKGKTNPAGPQNLAETFGVETCASMNVSKPYPVMVTTEHRLSAMARDLVDFKKLKQVYDRSERAVKGYRNKMMWMSGVIFGEENASLAAESTMRFIKQSHGAKQIPSVLIKKIMDDLPKSGVKTPEEMGFENEVDMGIQWIGACTNYIRMLEMHAYNSRQFTKFRDSYQKIYSPKFTTGPAFDTAIAAWNNHKIIANPIADTTDYDRTLRVFDVLPKQDRIVSVQPGRP